MYTFRDLTRDLGFTHPIKLAIDLRNAGLPVVRHFGIKPATVLEPTFAAVIADFATANIAWPR